MDIKWKDSTRSYGLVIKYGKIKLIGRLTKANKKSPYHISCPDLKLEKDICNNDFFIKKGIVDDFEKINIAKEKSIEAIKKELNKRKQTYELLYTSNLDELFIWKQPSKSMPESYDFSFMNGKSKVCGIATIIYSLGTSYLDLPWMNIGMQFGPAKDEDELKVMVYEIIKKACFEKLEILKNF